MVLIYYLKFYDMSVEKGKWYVDRYPTHARVLVYVEEVKKDYVIGYGIDNRYEWRGPGNKWYVKNLDHLAEASKDEVLERLKKFAIHLGYVEGVTLLGSLISDPGYIKDLKVENIYKYDMQELTRFYLGLDYEARYLMVDGKWLPFSTDSVLNDLNEEPVVQESSLIFKCL
jgi:hypothetical protein